MIAAIVRGGRSSSFKGALDYVLREDPDRVGETETANLFSKPEQAHREMQDTADAAKAIQARARRERGERTGASGSRSEKNCFHYALSWHPDDEPSTEQMMRCAHQTLDRLGLSYHQAVFVEHTEKPHKHVHVIVSTCDPETGRTNSLHRNAHILDRWCFEYEKEQGMFREAKRSEQHRREQEKAEADKLTGAKRDRWEAHEKRRQDLWEKQKVAVAELKDQQDERKEKIEDRIREVRRAADLAWQKLRETQVKQLEDFWQRDAPKMKLESRPSGAMIRPILSQPAEIVHALKNLERAAPQVDHLGFDKAHPAPEPKAKLEQLPVSMFAAAWADRNGFRDALESYGIDDRYDGEKVIKQWHKSQGKEITAQTNAV